MQSGEVQTKIYLTTLNEIWYGDFVTPIYRMELSIDQL